MQKTGSDSKRPCCTCRVYCVCFWRWWIWTCTMYNIYIYIICACMCFFSGWLIYLFFFMIMPRTLTELNWTDDDDATYIEGICQERFGVHQQVLLSCTHVFHRACLRAFEQHSGVRSCPLCRKEDYQARLINVSHSRLACNPGISLWKIRTVHMYICISAWRCMYKTKKGWRPRPEPTFTHPLSLCIPWNTLPLPPSKDGITEHVTRAAIVIQAAYRGYRARRIYGPVLAEHIPVDPKLRQKFYNQKVANVTATIVADANKRANVSHV